MEWIIHLPILFFSVIIHEFCHGWAAWSRGDDTAEKAGRLTLNPLAHVDPFGTVFLPFLCLTLGMPMFGWAKPVPVNDRNLEDPRRDGVKVALAGPAANLALAFLSALAYRLVSLGETAAGSVRAEALDALFFAISVNLLLAFFNLVPLHPLDGGKALSGLLPARARRAYDRMAPYGLAAVLLMIFTPAFSFLVLKPSGLAIELLRQMGLIG